MNTVIAPVLLLCAHGSTAAAAQTATQGIADAVAGALPDTDVVLTWVDVQHPDVNQRCEQFAHRPVVVVPLLLAAGFHVYSDLTQAVAGRAHHVVTKALCPDRALSRIMARYIQDTDTVDQPATDAELVLVAAGSSDPRAVRAVRQQAADLAELTGRQVSAGFVSAAYPPAQQAITKAQQRSGVWPNVVSFHLAEGVFHNNVMHAANAAAHTSKQLASQQQVNVSPPLVSTHQPVPQELIELIIRRWEEGKAAL